MRKRLEYMADRLEHVLASHRVPARVTGGTVTPRWVRFQVLPALGVKISRVKGLSDEMAAALDATSCRVSSRGAAVSVEVPRDDPQPVRLLPLYDQLTSRSGDGLSIPSVTAVLGFGEDGSPLLIRLPSPDVAHVLVSGTTGSGKTVLLQTMITSMAMSNSPDDLSMLLVDPKRHAFGCFSGLPHLVRPVISEIEDVNELLCSVVRLMERRSVSDAGSPAVVVFIDELADLLMMGGKGVMHSLTRLTQRGREVGIHIVAATQKPAAAVLGPLIKSNFPVRLVGRVTSVEDARTATGWSGTGAERLTGRGDFLAVAEGRVIRFQVAHVDVDEIGGVVAGLVSSKVERGRQSRGRALPLGLLLDSFRQKPQSNEDDSGELARRLVDWEKWPGRFRDDGEERSYVWGFKQGACRFLFKRPAAGSLNHRIDEILALAEEISSTTTTTTVQDADFVVVEEIERVVGSSSSSDLGVLHADKAGVSPRLTRSSGDKVAVATRRAWGFAVATCVWRELFALWLGAMCAAASLVLALISCLWGAR